MGNLFSVANVTLVLQALADLQAEVALLKTLLSSVQSTQTLTNAQLNSVHTSVNNIHSSFTTNALAAGAVSNATVVRVLNPTPSSS